MSNEVDNISLTEKYQNLKAIMENRAVATATLLENKQITSTKNWEVIYINLNEINTSNAEILKLENRWNKNRERCFESKNIS